MNYNTLRNKPTINYKEIIGDNTVSEVGGITEEEFDDLLDTDLASYYTKEQIDELFSRSFVYREKSGSIVTFDCPESTTSGITKVVSDIVAVQSGTGDPSPTNIRPISGLSAVNVYRVGDNMGNCADIPEPLTANKWYTVNLPYDTYTISFDVANVKRVQTGNTSLFNINGSNNILADRIYSVEDGSTYQSKGANVSGRFYFTYTGKFSSIGCYWRSNTYQFLSSGSLENIMIERGANPTKQYIPYNGTTYTTTLKDEQGNPMTCYGGQLVNENGVQSLELTHGYIASYNGETLPSTWISDRDVYAEGTTPTTGAEVVYELATPQQIPQDSLSIATQEGVNNLWADSGDITVTALDRIIQE